MDTPIVRLLCLRHGETKYTDKFPDLTPEGILSVKNVAREVISDWVKPHRSANEPVIIETSPSPRARGTADIIYKELRLPIPWVTVPEIMPIKWRDPDRCAKAIKTLQGYIDYENEPLFKNEALFEQQHEIWQRTGGYLRSLIIERPKGTRPKNIILVSHYEILCQFTAKLWELTPTRESALRHVEPLELHFFEPVDGRSTVYGRFRATEARGTFDLRSLTLWS